MLEVTWVVLRVLGVMEGGMLEGKHACLGGRGSDVEPSRCLV